MEKGDSTASMGWCGRIHQDAQCSVLSAAVCCGVGRVQCAGVLCELGCACGGGGTGAVGHDDADVGLAGRK